MTHSTTPLRRAVVLLAAVSLTAAACGGDDADTTADATDDTGTTAVTTDVTTDTADVTDDTGTTADTTDVTTDTVDLAVAFTCDEIAAQFTTNGSANADLADPVSEAVCDDGQVTVTANGIPDYTYIETSPGQPREQDYAWTFAAAPTVAAETTAIPLVGELGVALNGIPIYGATEGTGGDVLSLANLNECGSHNGPTGFHVHLMTTSETTDCMFTPEEVAAESQLFGYALDGYPIYTGNDQYTSSWELTDESLFATDTWAAHTYVEGSGDLDECNGLVDAEGNYAYYTTDTFPYTLGCFVGEVELTGPGEGGRGGPPPGD